MNVDGRSVKAGALSGLAGGVLFGTMMHAMGSMEMVAMLVGATAVAVGWLVHLVISAIFGVLYALTLGALTQSYGRGVGFGAVYGVIAWVVGALVIMPMWLGMSEMVFVVGQDQVLSLVGHVLFGIVLGAAYHGITAREGDAARAV